MPRFQPEEILRTLLRCEVEFLLIGGVAATLYGSNLRTGDVDICPRRSPENHKRLATALRALEARLTSDSKGPPSATSLIRIWSSPVERREPAPSEQALDHFPPTGARRRSSSNQFWTM